MDSIDDPNIPSSNSRDEPLQVINFVSVLPAAKLRMISEGLVHKHLYAVSATSFGFAGFYDGVQLTNLVFLNSEGQNNAAVEKFRVRNKFETEAGEYKIDRREIWKIKNG